MNKFKKFAATVIATATVLTGMSFPVSATTYDCDVNDDGAVTVADVTAISKYLVGNLKVPDYNRLDTNKSLTVDNMDVQCVLAEMMDWSYDCDYFSRATQQYSNAPSVSSVTLNEATSQPASRVYWKGCYDDNGKIASQSQYILRLSTSTLSTGTSTYVRIGTDERYLATGSENCGIVRLSTGATGFIVDDHHIATNAHNVYNKDENYWNDMTHINTYNEQGILQTTRLTPIEAHFPNEFLEDGRYDYALITVKEDLSNYVHFDLGTSYNVTAANFKNVPIYVTGCSQFAPNGNLNTENRLYSGEGRIIQNNNTINLHYNVDTTSGNSGSPVYTITRNIVNNEPTYTYTVLGIHYGGATDSYNCAALTTKYLLQFYRNNSNASWEE